ncbi:MAG: glycosyltransferase, partial [Burkholderiaceae bacterium]|nr:glycosyltransferase [Burkholderiaceae bacterium]
MYNASDLYVTTTLGEGWGLTLTEAMATRTPVICPISTSFIEMTDNGKRVYAVENLIPISVDRTDITVDSTLLTVDRITEYDPITSYTNNGISIAEYLATRGQETFEVKVNANTNWYVSTPLPSWLSIN